MINQKGWGVEIWPHSECAEPANASHFCGRCHLSPSRTGSSTAPLRNSAATVPTHSWHILHRCLPATLDLTSLNKKNNFIYALNGLFKIRDCLESFKCEWNLLKMGLTAVKKASVRLWNTYQTNRLNICQDAKNIMITRRCPRSIAALCQQGNKGKNNYKQELFLSQRVMSRFRL